MEDNTNSIGERAEFDKKMVEKNEYMPVRLHSSLQRNALFAIAV